MTEELPLPPEDNQEIKKVNPKKQKPKNIYKILTIIFAILLIITIIKPFSGGISEGEAKEKVLKHINAILSAQGAMITADITAVKDKGNLYELEVNIGGQESDMFVTKDGELFFPTSIDLTEPLPTITGTTTQEIPKTDKPKLELYIFSYCPAGSAGLEEFAPVANLFKEKADFRVRFFSHMHGEYERQQNIIQGCIQDLEPEKYFDYAEDFLEKVYKQCAQIRDVSCDREKAIALMKEKQIDSEKVLKCITEKGEQLYNEDMVLANQFGLSASPSIIVNDVSLGPEFDRSQEGIKQLMCQAFEEPPKECEQTLSTTGSEVSGSC